MGQCAAAGGKREFKSKRAAEAGRKSLRATSADSMHAYRCPEVPSHWHLGHAPQMPHGDKAPDMARKHSLRFSPVEWDQATLLLWARTKGRCDCCGDPIGENAQRHHRQRRRDGGDRLANLVLLHPDCHAWVHAHPENARPRGLIVAATGDADPAVVPLVDDSGRAWLLDDEGGRRNPPV